MGVLRVVGGLFGIVGWVVFIGLQRLWRGTFGWLFNTLADLIENIGFNHFGISFHPFGPVANWLRSLNHNVYAQLGYLALQSEQLAVWLFSRVRYVFAFLGREIEGLSADVLGLGVRLLRVYLPRWLHRLERQFVRGWSKIWHYVRSQIPGILRLLKRYGRSIAHAAGVQLHRWIKQLRLFAWLEGKVLKFIRAAAKRLTALERHFVPKGLRKWFAAIFPLFGIAWLLGSSWKRLGEGLLKWSYNMVGAFLAYFGRIDASHSIDDLVHHAEGLVPKMITEIEFLISEFKPERLAPGPIDEPPIT